MNAAEIMRWWRRGWRPCTRCGRYEDEIIALRQRASEFETKLRRKDTEIDTLHREVIRLNQKIEGRHAWWKF